MFEQKCRIKDLAKTLTDDYVLSLTVPRSILQHYDKLNDKDLRVVLKPWREKRSLDANAYFWVLCDKLAEKTGQTKTDIYRTAIRDIGGNSETYCGRTEAVEKLCSVWRQNGLGWQAEVFDSKLDGCTNAVLYYGSSVYDNAQMSRLIDNIVQDCKAVGIETLTPEQLDKLKESWH